MKKSTYIISLAISFGVLMVLVPAGTYVATKIITFNREQQEIKTAAITSDNNGLYDSVREIMAQRNYAVADELIDYAISSLGTGEHTASEIAGRIDDIIAGKVTTHPTTTANKTSIDNFDFIVIVLISLLLVIIIGLSVQLAHGMVDKMIDFHTVHNTANLSRQPIKAFIEHQNLIKYVFTYGFFIGSFIVFYGAIFKMKI